jgi:alpha-mannosidase
MANDSPDVLFFKSESDGHPRGYSYITIATSDHVVQVGDVFEYEIFIDVASPRIQAGADITFASGRALRDLNIVDQHWQTSKPYAYLLDASGSWFHRRMDLSSLAGERIESVEIAIVAPLEGVYVACFKRVVVTRDGEVVASFYESGEPERRDEALQLGFSKNVVEPIREREYRASLLRYVDPPRVFPDVQFAKRLVEILPDERDRLAPLIDEAIAALDFDAFRDNDDERYEASVRRARDVLSPVLVRAKEYTTHLIGHAHIDMNWLWVWAETEEVILRDARTLVSLMERFPFFKFSQSQAVAYDVIRKRDPELFERVKKFVAAGQWEITASMWVEGDENMASGESLARQFLLANRFVKRHFGVEPEVCWQPDLFGHVRTMPQILRQCGVKYYYHMRCAKENPSVVRWRGPDGSEVIAAATPDYNGAMGPETRYRPLELDERQSVKDYLHCFGVGDHGGGPTARDIGRGLDLIADPRAVSARFSTAAEYFKTIEAKGYDLPVVDDELQFIFEGCYTTHADVKRVNREGENALATAETFGAIAEPYELPYPRQILKRGWERVCFNQFHDILPGSAIHAVYEEAVPAAEAAIAGARSATRKSFETLAEEIDHSGFAATPLVVFNPAGAARSDLVDTTLPLAENDGVEILDETGAVVPSQIVSRNDGAATVAFVAENVPSVGYRSYQWRRSRLSDDMDANLIGDDLRLENDLISVEIDAATGAVSSFVDKRDGFDYAGGAGFNGFQLLSEKPVEMSAWEIGEIAETRTLASPSRVTVVERGPVRGTVEIVHEWEESRITQRVSLARGADRLESRVVVEWNETGDRNRGGKFLKATFPSALEPDKIEARFEVPFGDVAREPNGAEYPTQRWTRIADDARGLTVANDAQYGCDVSGATIRLSLLRASYDPDPEPDRGVHRFRFGVKPSRTADEAREFGEAFNQRLEAISVYKKEGTLPTSRSFVSIDKPNVAFSTLKKAEDDDDLILRAYETRGAATDATIALGFAVKAVRAADMLERPTDEAPTPIDDDVFAARFNPYEIKTFKIKRSPFAWKKRHDFKPA